MRVGAIDCGTNSVRLLIAEQTQDGVRELERDLHLTRLGQGVDASGAFAPDALARTLDALADFGARLRGAGVERTRVVATSAARDAANRDAFFAGVLQRVGAAAEIISGEEEARLSFTGALSASRVAAEPVLVMDIGGGSTELALGRADGRLDAARSLDVGAVRLRERFLQDDPPTRGQVAAASDYVDGLLDADTDVERARTWIGVGGTATSLSALAQGLDAYDRTRVHGSVVARDALVALAERLLASPIEEVAALPTMQPKRADVIAGGALICARIAARSSVDLLVSEADILDGLVLGLLGGA